MTAADVTPRVTVLGPDPLIGIAIEARDGRDDVLVQPAGQGVWVSRMAGELGAWPILCCLVGGDNAHVLESLLDTLPGERSIVRTSSANGTYVTTDRGGGRQALAASLRPAPLRREIDDLVAATCAAALRSRVLVLCNPYPAEGFPEDVYETIAADVHAAGIPVIVDLSSPRLEHTLPYQPDLVKINDWELAEYVYGPVDGQRALDAARRVCDAGARAVAVTRAAEPILVMPSDGDPFELVPPRLPLGFREGCGDAMTGAIAAAWARGLCLEDALVLGAAAGSVNFLHHDLGAGRRGVIEALAAEIPVQPVGAQAGV